MTFKTTAYLEGKPTRGQQHAVVSGKEQKRGMLSFRESCVHGETGTVKPEFPRDDTPHPPDPFLTGDTEIPHIGSLCGKALLSMRRVMNSIGNRRAPKHTTRFLCAKAGSPTGRESYGDGTLIVVGRKAKRLLTNEGAAPEGGLERARDTSTQGR